MNTAQEKELNMFEKAAAEFAKKQQVYNYYLKNGGYPALVNIELNDNDRFEWLKMYDIFRMGYNTLS
mgnify:CR=1 FL=1